MKVIFQQASGTSSNGLPPLTTSRSLGDISSAIPKSKATSKSSSKTVTTVIQCHIPEASTSIEQAKTLESNQISFNKSGSDFRRPGKFRNSLKVLAGGVCRGLGGQTGPIRNLSRNRNRASSSDSSSDDVKMAKKESRDESSTNAPETNTANGVDTNDDKADPNINDEPNTNLMDKNDISINDGTNVNIIQDLKNTSDVDKIYEPKDKGRSKKSSKPSDCGEIGSTSEINNQDSKIPLEKTKDDSLSFDSKIEQDTS